MKLEYKLSEVKPRIFFLNFKDTYDMCMTFLRYQEFYESPNPKFRGKPFDLFEFMRWYSKKYGEGGFTYARDWAGFNIPGEVVVKLWVPGILNRTIYDYEMKMVYDKCLSIYPDGKFYLIGAVGKKWAMRHEIAHGFYYTQPLYKQEMDIHVKALSKLFRKKMNVALKNIGYTTHVYVDETQAYMSTGVPEKFNLNTKKLCDPFIAVYEDYYKRL